MQRDQGVHLASTSSTPQIDLFPHYLTMTEISSDCRVTDDLVEQQTDPISSKDEMSPEESSASRSSASMVSEIKKKRRMQAYGSNSRSHVNGEETGAEDGNTSASGAKADNNENNNETDSDNDSVATVEQEVHINSDLFNVDALEQLHGDDEVDDDEVSACESVSSENVSNAGKGDAVAENNSNPVNSEQSRTNQDFEEMELDEPESEQGSNDEEEQDEPKDQNDDEDEEMAEGDQEEHEEEEMKSSEDDVIDGTNDAAESNANDQTSSIQAEDENEDEDKDELMNEDEEDEMPEVDEEEQGGENENEQSSIDDASDSNSIKVAPSPAEETSSIPPSPSKNAKDVTDQNILDTVDNLFSDADVQSMTVKDIICSIEDLFEIKLGKDRKKMVKERLVALVNQKNEDEPESEQEQPVSEEGDAEDVSDYSESEDEAPNRSRKGKSKVRGKTSRPRRTPKMRKPSHVKIHHESLRKRQLAEAKIRAEELRESEAKKISEEDRKRAEAIAKKFQTDTEELRKKRMEDRMGLLGLLKEKRVRLLEQSGDYDWSDTGDQGTVESNDSLPAGMSRNDISSIPSLQQQQENGGALNTLQVVITDDNTQSDSKGSESGHSPMNVSTKLPNQLHDEANDRDHDASDRSSSEYESGSDSDSDEELEILGFESGKSKTPPISTKQEEIPSSFNRKSSPKSVIAYFSQANADRMSSRPISNKKMFSNPRAKLRNALKAKQFENGNKWLARELGFDNAEDHIRDCIRQEKKKKRIMLQQEQQRLKGSKENGQVQTSSEQNEEGSEEGNSSALDEKEEEVMERTRVNLDQESEPEEEEDEELALAREIESAEKVKHGNIPVSHDSENVDREIEEDQEELIHDSTQEAFESNVDDLNDESPGETLVEDFTQEPSISPYSEIVEEATVVDNMNESTLTKNSLPEVDSANEQVAGEEEDNVDEGEAEASLETSPGTHQVKSEGEVEKKPRNAAWKAMLKKEADLLKKQKANRGKGKLVEVEAEEEEEEEGVAGLEDFGFTMESKKKSGEDEDNVEADDEDFENIVDDVSDNEGDEEAGEAARQAMAHKEEKLRHKEIMRRMREGYDGKRGGIAGSAGARGNLRFDQLVAADNKDDAKRLGLLNDDELDSDDEGGEKSENEVEDEMVLLDKMLKDRYLNKTDVPAEEFSDSEDEEDNGDNEETSRKIEDEEDIEQENLARRFARRARMNRLLELHGNEKEFSQGRLKDQDGDFEKELRSIRTVCNKTKRQTSWGSSRSGGDTTSFSALSNSSFGVRDATGTSDKSLLCPSSSLSFVISKSKVSSKRKAGFLRSSRKDGKSKSAKRNKTSGITLGHVVFSENGQSVPLSRTSSLSLGRSSIKMAPKRRASSDPSGKQRQSLWSKVASNGFKKQRGLSSR